MSEVWNKVYNSDSFFFGEEPSNFALLCLNHMKTNNAKRVLEVQVTEETQHFLHQMELKLMH
jgi:hypothetical protein